MKKIIILCLLFPILSCSTSDQDSLDSCLKQTKPSIYVDKLAKANNMFAQAILGSMYRAGLGVKQDYKQAVYWYTKSANQGYAKAQLNLGVMYYNGQGIKQDYKQALDWYTKSANQGDAQAKYNLGIMYEYREGVKQNRKQADKQAVDWFTKSANQGNAMAQKKLGNMYEYGKGVEANVVKSYAWYSISVDTGNSDASDNLEILEREMSSDQINQAKDMAKELLKNIKKP